MTYRFGVFEFDVQSGELRRQGRVVPLEPQPSRALARLLSEPGEVVPRDALKDAVWGADTHVDFDRGLAYCLSHIRSALGDTADNPRFVQTLPRRGYRFIAPIAHDAPPAASAPSAPPAPSESVAPSAPRPSWPAAAAAFALAVAAIALVMGVMPAPVPRAVVAVSIFDNETGLAQYDRLVTGLSDVVVAHLANLAPSRVAVVGNAAVLRQPRNIRNLQGIRAGVRADYVILGQLQQDAAGLRFITHFIRLDDETHLKANRISMPGSDVSGLEAAVVSEFDRAVRDNVLEKGDSPLF